MRRNWIKLYCDQTLRGTCFTELAPDERFVFFGFLLLAGDSAIEGKIALTETMGYIDPQIAELLKIDLELLLRAKEKMIKFDKIKVLENNIILIVNWTKYQSEYQRQKKYREDGKEEELFSEVTEESNNEKLQSKVTGRKEGDKKEIRQEGDQTEEKNKALFSNEEIDKLFEDFWKNYPKDGRHGKKSARIKFGAIVKAGRLKDIYKATNGYNDYLWMMKDEKNFDQRACYATTFLNGRFEEYIEFVRRPRL